MNNNIRAAARSFLNEYKLSEVTLDNLKEIIKSQGYTIVEFNNIFNEENVTQIIDALGVNEQVEKAKGFTYADSKRRIVFLNEDLSNSEKLLVLAHEEGHIYCNHFSSVPIIGREVVEEHEANEFTHYILNNSIGQKIGIIIKKRRKPIIISLAIILVILIGMVVIGVIQKEQSYYGDYYMTSTGNKYHEEECIFVKDKTNIHRMTIEEFESGEYEPCEICLPHDSK